MSKIIVSYPFDLSGTVTSNRTKHDIVLGSGSFNRAFAYPTGPFFADTFKLYEASRPNVPLVRGKDYQLLLLNTTLRKMTSREICSAVVVHNPEVSTDVISSAQIVGGPYAANIDAIEQAINALDLDNRQIDFSDLSGVPDEFVTAPAYSDIGDIFGFEYTITVLAQILDAIKVGDNAEVKQLSQTVTEMREELRNMFQQHIDSTGNVHELTRAQMSVPSVSEMNKEIQDVMTEFNKLASRIGSLEAADTNINSKIKSINDSFETVANQLTNIRQNYQRTNQNVADLSQQVSTYESEILKLTQRTTQLEQSVADILQQLNGYDDEFTTINDTLREHGQGIEQNKSTLENHLSDPTPHDAYNNDLTFNVLSSSSSKVRLTALNIFTTNTNIALTDGKEGQWFEILVGTNIDLDAGECSVTHAGKKIKLAGVSHDKIVFTTKGQVFKVYYSNGGWCL